MEVAATERDMDTDILRIIEPATEPASITVSGQYLNKPWRLLAELLRILSHSKRLIGRYTLSRTEHQVGIILRTIVNPFHMQSNLSNHNQLILYA
jgi:hypothetical protein